jgi:hypothetical protein
MISKAVIEFVMKNKNALDRDDFEYLLDSAADELTIDEQVVLLQMFLEAGISVFEHVTKPWAEQFANHNKYLFRELGMNVEDFLSGRIVFKSHLPRTTAAPTEAEKRKATEEQRAAEYRRRKEKEDTEYRDKIAKAKADAPEGKPKAPVKKELTPEEIQHREMINAYGKFEELLKNWGVKYNFTTYVLPYMRNLTNEDTELSFGFTLGDGKRISHKKLGTAKYDQGEYKFDFTSLDAKVPAIKKKIQQEWAYSGIDPKLLK